MSNLPLGPKDPDEIKVLKFDFARDLDGANITSVQAVTATVVKGVDTNPANLLAGAAQASGTIVMQRLQGGVSGVVYRVRVRVQDSNNNVHVATDTVLVKTL
jgi:hypothetical protein